MSELSATLEAILFSSNRPLKLRELQQAVGSDRTAVENALDELKQALAIDPTYTQLFDVINSSQLFRVVQVP